MSNSERRGRAVSTATDLAALGFKSRTGIWLPWVVSIVIFLSPSMNTPRSLLYPSEFIVHLWVLLFDGMMYEIVTALFNSAYNSPETRRLEVWQGKTIRNSGQKRLNSHSWGIRPLIVVVSVGQMFPCVTCCGLRVKIPCSLVVNTNITKENTASTCRV